MCCSTKPSTSTQWNANSAPTPRLRHWRCATTTTPPTPPRPMPCAPPTKPPLPSSRYTTWCPAPAPEKSGGAAPRPIPARCTYRTISTSSRYAESVTEQPPPPPAEEVSAQLRLAGQIHRLSVVLARPFQQEFAATHGVSLAEWRVQVQVVRHPGITATQVAAATGLTAMNVSRAVHALRRQNLLTARTDPDDSRRNLLQATDAGAHLYHQLAPHAVRDIGEIMA